MKTNQLQWLLSMTNMLSAALLPSSHYQLSTSETSLCMHHCRTSPTHSTNKSPLHKHTPIAHTYITNLTKTQVQAPHLFQCEGSLLPQNLQHSLNPLPVLLLLSPHSQPKSSKSPITQNPVQIKAETAQAPSGNRSTGEERTSVVLRKS